LGNRSRRKGRPISGILLLDKPKGKSSNGILQHVKHLYGASKAGHTGSLDPLATGMLPICFGEATKFSQHLLNADKTYSTIARLGQKTNTGDAEGEIIQERDIALITTANLLSVTNHFLGEIEQVPPMYSALKHQGQPLYKLARKGIEIERKPRKLTIHSIDAQILDPFRIQFKVSCSKGTYIRSLVEDIGEMLGCGAHVEELRRLTAGPFISGMLTVEQLEEQEAEKGAQSLDEHLLPVNSAVESFNSVVLCREMADNLCQGKKIEIDDQYVSQFSNDPLLQVWLDTDGAPKKFLGVASILDGLLVPRRLITTN